MVMTRDALGSDDAGVRPAGPSTDRTMLARGNFATGLLGDVRTGGSVPDRSDSGCSTWNTKRGFVSSVPRGTRQVCARSGPRRGEQEPGDRALGPGTGKGERVHPLEDEPVLRRDHGELPVTV